MEQQDLEEHPELDILVDEASVEVQEHPAATESHV